MKKYYLLSSLFLLSNCMVEPKVVDNRNLIQASDNPPKLNQPQLTQSQQTKSNNEPLFNIKFNGFLVLSENSNDPTATDLDQRNARILTQAEKQVMLEHLDLVRLVVNSDLFEVLLKQRVTTGFSFADGTTQSPHPYTAARSVSGPSATVIAGSAYNPDRLLKVVRDAALYVQIRKLQIPLFALAVGVVGDSVYALSDTDPKRENSYWIGFPNRNNWTAPASPGSNDADYTDHNFIASIVFHEILHNLGFSHLDFVGGRPDPEDTVYALQQVFDIVLATLTTSSSPGATDFTTRRNAFEPYYPEIFSSMIAGDTPATAFSRNFAFASTDGSGDPIICVILPDGTFKLQKMSTLK